MKRIAHSHLPRMRVEHLVVDELKDEVLVYDLDRHQAHCLNQTAALVWKACDGRRTPAAIAAHLNRQSEKTFDEELVWLALGQLRKLRLLDEQFALPPRFAGMSRRQMIRKLGIAAAVGVPLITSIVAPTAAEAATCVASGAPCSGTILCCSSMGCNPMTNQCF